MKDHQQFVISISLVNEINEVTFVVFMINWYKERCQKALHWNSRKDKLTFIPVQLMAHKFAKLKGVVSQQSSSLSVIFPFTHPFSLFNLTITQKLLLRTFAPIATAHFFAHVTHTSCMAGHEGKRC